MANDLELALVRGPSHRQVHDRRSRGDQGDDGLLGFFREGVDRIDPVLDVVQGAIGISGLEQLDGDLANALDGRRAYLVDALDTLERLFNADADAFFDLFRCCTQVLHAYGDQVVVQIRKRFLRHERQADHARHDDDAKQQIGSDGVARKPGDRAVHDAGASRRMVATAGAGSSATRTRMPSAVLCSGETQTHSPALRPSLIRTSS